MKVSVLKRNNCRLCGEKNLELVLSLTPTPVGDDFIPAARLDESQETFPLDLLLCRLCGNVQLLNIVDPEVVYGEYTYTSSISLELPDHFRKYADDILNRINHTKGSLIVEIGSNEGTLLNFLKSKEMKVLGIDPARNIALKATETGIETIPAFFTAELAKTIRKKYGQASIVIANNVIANIDDLSDTIDGVRNLLSHDGIFVFETSYLLDVIEKNLIDTVFHEHISYLAVKPLEAFFRRHGMELIKTERVPTKGGSIRGTVQLVGGSHKVSPSVNGLIALEEKSGIFHHEAFTSLADKLDSIKKPLHSLLENFKARNKTIACYGAAVGLTTMMYYFDLSRMLSFIVDDNLKKQNTFSPGYHIPVYSSQTLYEKKPDYVLILAWRYADSIIRKHQKYLEQGGQFIKPLPELEIIKK